MENRSHALVAGLFTLGFLLALIVVGAWLGHESTAQVPYYLITNSSISGLSEQASVKYRGVEVGRIERIRLEPGQTGRLLLRLSVDPATPITPRTFARLSYQGLTGIAYVQLDEARAAQATLPPYNGIAQIPLVPGALDGLVQQSGRILTQLEQASGRVNDFFDPTRQKIIFGALQEIGAAAAALSSLAQHVDQRVLPAADALPSLMTQTRAAVAQTEAAAQRVAALASTAQQALDRAQTPGGALFETAQTMLDFRAVSRQLQQDTLPRWSRLSRTGERTLRELSETARELGQSPNALLFGITPVPGPGEPGFDWHAAPADSAVPAQP